MSEKKVQEKATGSGDEKKSKRVSRWGPLIAALAAAERHFDHQLVATSVDVSRVGERLYLGALTAARNLKWLQHAGVTHILSVMQDWTSANIGAGCRNPTEYKFDLGLKRKYVPVQDNYSTDLRRHFSPCFHWIDEALRGGGTVLVHCHMGISRSSTIVCSYLMRKNQQSLDHILDDLRKKRRCVCPNDSFMAQLRLFEQDRDKIIRKRHFNCVVHQLCTHRLPFPVSMIVVQHLEERPDRRRRTRRRYRVEQCFNNHRHEPLDDELPQLPTPKEEYLAKRRTH